MKSYLYFCLPVARLALNLLCFLLTETITSERQPSTRGGTDFTCYCLVETWAEGGRHLHSSPSPTGRKTNLRIILRPCESFLKPNQDPNPDCFCQDQRSSSQCRFVIHRTNPSHTPRDQMRTKIWYYP